MSKDKMSIKVSIIIPIYNVASYIIDCLDSVNQQDYDNLEVILIDDCGTDSSMDAVAAYLNENAFKNIKILHHTHNRGLSAARNTGLKEASGEYVYFLDSDDTIFSDCIRLLVKPLEKFRYDFVIADYEASSHDKEYPPLLLPEGEICTNGKILETYAQGLWYMMAWNKLCRKDFLLANNLFFEEGILHEDVVWSFKLACKAQSMYICRKISYWYRIRTSSIMTNTSLEKDICQYIRVYELISQFVKEEKLQGIADVYTILEGRKSTLLFTLLQKKEMVFYKRYYQAFYRIRHISPWKAWRSGIVGIKYFIRDFHYLLPVSLGRIYKFLFYCCFYKWPKRKIEGGMW